MVLTRAQRKRLQKMVDEAADSGLVESLQPAFEYAAPAQAKRARRATAAPDSAQCTRPNGDDVQLDACHWAPSAANDSPAQPLDKVGAVGAIGAVAAPDYLAPSIGDFEFAHTMTYNACSNFTAPGAGAANATGDEARSSAGDLGKCTCYFRSLRSFVDLPPHLGREPSGGAVRFPAAKRATLAAVAAAAIGLLTAAYCWQRGGLPAMGKALVSPAVEEQRAPAGLGFWARLYDGFLHLFWA